MTNKRRTPSENVEYTVGYGRPPKANQWKKGISGNPSGRRKGSLNSKTVLAEIFSKPVTITEGGQQVEVAAVKALFIVLLSAALKGNMKAATYLSDNFIQLFGGEEEPVAGLADDDAVILERHVRRRMRDAADPPDVADDDAAILGSYVRRRTGDTGEEPMDSRPDPADGDEPVDDEGDEPLDQDGGGDGRP